MCLQFNRAVFWQLLVESFHYAGRNGEEYKGPHEEDYGQKQRNDVQEDALPPPNTHELTVEDNNIGYDAYLINDAQYVVGTLYEAQGQHDDGDEQADARVVHLGVELLGEVQGELLSVGTCYPALPEDPSVGKGGEEHYDEGAEELIGTQFSEVLHDELYGCVFRCFHFGSEVEVCHVVEDGIADTQDVGDDGVEGEHEDVQLQGVVVPGTLAEQIVAHHVARTADEVATGAKELVVATNEGADEVVDDFGQTQALGLGLLSAIWAEIALEGVMAVEAFHSQGSRVEGQESIVSG